MNLEIRPMSNDPNEIVNVQKFLFKMIKKEFGYDYVPEWHQDIVKMDEYYINPKINNFFVAYGETGEIIATIGIRAYDKDFPEFRQLYSKDTTSSIWRLFVDERFRRCGLASKMFSIAENFANEAGYDKIYLHTHKIYFCVCGHAKIHFPHTVSAFPKFSSETFNAYFSHFLSS